MKPAARTARLAALVALLLAAALELPACARPVSAAAPAGPLPQPGQVKLEPLPDYVRVAPVERISGGGVTAATGRVTFDEERASRVGSPVSGRVVDLLVHPGDRVRKGQGLLVIASPDAESAVADHVAALADAAVAEKALERVGRLFSEQAVPYKEVLQAQSDSTKAAAAVARARARLEVLGIDPARAARTARFVLRAPIDGTVVDRPAFPGMEVRPDSGAPLVTVADLSRLWVLADVYERDLALVAAGRAATIRVPAWPERAFPGTVTHVGDVVDPATRTVKVRVDVENPQRALKPEMFARVTLAGGPGTPALAIPSEALLSDGPGSAVIVALGGGRFEKRAIESGPEHDGRVRVLAGLHDGEQVVVDGAIYLRAAIEGL